MTQRDSILVWVAKFGFSTSVIISEMLGIPQKKARDLLSVLSSPTRKSQKTGKTYTRIQYLKRLDVLGYQGQRIYMLTEEGLAQATLALAVDYRYDFRSSSIDQTRMLHSIGVQFICAVLFARSEEKDLSQVVPERLLAFEKGVKIPDAVLFFNGKKTAIEFERSEKSGDRLDRFFQEIEAAIEEGYYDSFQVYSEVTGIIERYKKHAKTSFTRWQMHEKRWVKIGKETLSEKAKNNIKIIPLITIGKALRPTSYGIEMAKKGEKKDA